MPKVPPDKKMEPDTQQGILGVVRKSEKASAVKQCYEGCHVHGVQPRGTMVGLREGAGHERATTGVVGRFQNTGGLVGRCWNTGGLVGTHETRWKQMQGAINCLTRYM